MRSEKVAFANAAGEALAGVIDMPDARPRAFALFAHCFSCSKDIRAAREISRALGERGIAALRFDFAGLGASEGDFADTNFSTNVDDLVSAAAWLDRAHRPAALLIGHSLGGAAVLAAAARLPTVKAIAVIGAPADAAHVAHQFEAKTAEIRTAGAAQVTLAGRPFVIKKQFLDDIAEAGVLDAAATLRKPLLILHSPIDQTVGVDNAARLFAAARHPKSFVSLDDADHLLSTPRDARYAADVIAAWAARYIGGDGHAANGSDRAPNGAPDT